MLARKRLFIFIAVIQSVLFVTHFVLYSTWTFHSLPTDERGTLPTKLLFTLLSVSFLTASLLAFRYTNAAVRVFYRAAALWLGLLTFLFLAAVLSWTVFGVAR